MRWLTLLLPALAGCLQLDDHPGTGYLGDRGFRRATLEAALVNPANHYSQLRLAHYATGTDSDWDQLPEWNPALVDTPALALDEAETQAGLRALGEAAFFRYPTQSVPTATIPDDVESVGLWRDPTRQPLVEVRYSDGTSGLSLTCATCHAQVRDGVLVPGLGNQQLDYGALAHTDTHWGPGRIDVTPPPGEEPIAIPDLRPVAAQTHLHRDGTVRAGLVELAIRIETLIITAQSGTVRPPRLVALAVATYLYSLSPPSPTAASPGRAVFDSQCGACHAGPGLSGPPVLLATVGTDPRVGQSADRGTGGYRVPSLLGVATRGRLLHDNSMPDLETLLDPARTDGGHRFGLGLSTNDHQDLLAFLHTL